MPFHSNYIFRVKLFTLSLQSQVNQFNDNTSRFIILALIITAVMQVRGEACVYECIERNLIYAYRSIA